MPHQIFSRLLLGLLLIICLQGTAQSNTDQKKQNEYEQLKSLIASKKFEFKALSATTFKGRTIQLTSEYFLLLNNDSLQVDLPYYGRAFTADYPPTDQSIQFNTNQFNYKADSAKKGGWNITILPKNQSKANKIYMSVTTSGYCTTQVTSNSRQPVSFYGTISAFGDH